MMARDFMRRVCGLLLAGCSLLASAQHLSAGGAHSLAVRGDGSVWAFGSNAAGRLGDGSVNHRFRPTRVANLPQISAVAAGGVFSLALASNGSVWAWGENASGQLAVLPLSSRYTPWQVPGLPAMAGISAGFAHALALAGDGTVWAWGANQAGQLGDNSSIDKVGPAMVAGLSGIVAVSAGHEHNLAVSAKGKVYAWGANSRQQVSATGALSAYIARPVEIGGLPAIQAVAAGGSQSLALAFDGSVWAWGDGLNSAPRPLAALSQVVAIAAGKGGFSFALKSDGTLYAWGSNRSAVFGDGTTRDSAVPVVVTTAPRLRSIAAGYQHVLAEDGQSNVLAWGSNLLGQLGNGGSSLVALPSKIPAFSGVTALIAGQGLNVLALPSGLYAAGFGDRMSPSRLDSSDDLKALAAGAGYVLALSKAGLLRGWGANESGQLGLAADLSTHGTTAISQPSAIVDVAVNPAGRHNLVVDGNGKLWSWGNNEYGQLGDGGNLSRHQASVVGDLENVIAVAAGANFSLALRGDGSVWGWGDNTSGQLGDGTALPRNKPAKIAGLPQIKMIAAGYAHSLAVSVDGELWVWGANGAGQLGLGDIKSRLLPTRAGLVGVRLLTAGALHTLAWDGSTAWAWGDNSWGQLGVGDFTPRWAPTAIASSNAINKLVAGVAHSSAVIAQQLWFWGDDQQGQSGQPSLIEHMATPIDIGFNIGFVNLAKTLPFDIDLDVQGQASALTCRIGIRPPQSAIGQMREWYVAAELNGIWYAHNGTGWGMVGANGFPVYKTLELGPSQVINILNQQDVRTLAAGKVYVGYGGSWSQMLDEQNYRLVYQIPDR